MGVLPSPKSRVYEVIVPHAPCVEVEASKLTVKGAAPVIGAAVSPATGRPVVEQAVFPILV